jgi:hypothetical protein
MIDFCKRCLTSANDRPLLIADKISLYVDGEKYGQVLPGNGFSEEAKKANVTAATQWLRGSVMAPFDEMVRQLKYGISVTTYVENWRTTYIPLTLYTRRGSRGISDIARRPRFTKIM